MPEGDTRAVRVGRSVLLSLAGMHILLVRGRLSEIPFQQSSIQSCERALMDYLHPQCMYFVVPASCPRSHSCTPGFSACLRTLVPRLCETNARAHEWS